MKERWTRARLEAVIKVVEEVLRTPPLHHLITNSTDLQAGLKRLKDELKVIDLPGSW